MGIYKQPGKWECGPFALKHALLMRGVLASEWEIAQSAGAGREGTDEAQLDEAARRYGFELPTVRKLQADEARDELVEYLKDGVPCLLCVDDWDHWVTAVHEERERFIILDSEKPEVVVILDWPRLKELWVYHEEDEEGTTTFYDLHPLIPRDHQPARARFTLERALGLREPHNRTLAQLWDVYVEDLITICDSQESQGGRSASLGEFVRRHATLLLDQLESWHARIDRDAAAQVLERMRFVADTYGMTIRQSDEKRTIAAISMILALWSAGEFGVEPLYQKVPVRKIR